MSKVIVELDLATVEARAVVASLPLFEGLTHVVQVQTGSSVVDSKAWKTVAAFGDEATARECQAVLASLQQCAGVSHNANHAGAAMRFLVILTYVACAMAGCIALACAAGACIAPLVMP